MIGRGSRLLMVIGGALACVILAAGCSNDETSGGLESSLTVTGAVMGETVTDAAAIYLEINNASDVDVVLVSASCECSESASIHVTQHHGGLTQMEHIEQIVIGAQSSEQFLPGGTHVMLEQMHEDVTAGETIDLQLGFVPDGGQTEYIDVTVDVVPTADLAERVPQ